MAVVAPRVVLVGVLVIVLLKVVHQVHQRVEHMVHMLHIPVLMNVIKVIVEHVNVQVHVHQLAAQLEQRRRIREILILHIVVQMPVVNPRLEIVIVVFVHQLLVQVVDIVIQIWVVVRSLIH